MLFLHHNLYMFAQFPQLEKYNTYLHVSCFYVTYLHVTYKCIGRLQPNTKKHFADRKGTVLIKLWK